MFASNLETETYHQILLLTENDETYIINSVKSSALGELAIGEGYGAYEVYIGYTLEKGSYQWASLIVR